MIELKYQQEDCMVEKQVINGFLVELFNLILRNEEKALKEHVDGKLSISEYHVVEAVCKGIEKNANTMGEISKRLHITVGSLTVAVATLEKKGYLQRVKDEKDKRTVRILCTEEGMEVNNFHKNFHIHMMEQITAQLNEEQLKLMVDTILELKNIFTSNA